MGIVLLVLSSAMTVGLFVAGLRGARIRRLLLLAIPVDLVLWGLASSVAPSGDPDWTKGGYVIIFGFFAIVVFLVWTVAAILGLLVRTTVVRPRRDTTNAFR